MAKYIKARTMAHDPFADFLEEGLQTVMPFEDPALCSKAVTEGINLALSTGEFRVGKRSTVIATPWVPYAAEPSPLQPRQIIGSIRLEADLKHLPRSSRLQGLGQTTLRFAAQPLNANKPPAVLGTLEATGPSLRGRDGKFYHGDQTAFNLLYYLIHYDLKEFLLPKVPKADERMRLDWHGDSAWLALVEQTSAAYGSVDNRGTYL